jgi:hypothetical protein
MNYGMWRPDINKGCTKKRLHKDCLFCSSEGRQQDQQDRGRWRSAYGSGAMALAEVDLRANPGNAVIPNFSVELNGASSKYVFLRNPDARE